MMKSKMKTILEEHWDGFVKIYNKTKEVVEYFDEMDQSNIDEPPCFACEKCGGVMRPQKYNGVYGKKYKL